MDPRQFWSLANLARPRWENLSSPSNYLAAASTQATSKTESQGLDRRPWSARKKKRIILRRTTRPGWGTMAAAAPHGLFREGHGAALIGCCGCPVPGGRGGVAGIRRRGDTACRSMKGLLARAAWDVRTRTTTGEFVFDRNGPSGSVVSQLQGDYDRLASGISTRTNLPSPNSWQRHDRLLHCRRPIRHRCSTPSGQPPGKIRLG